MGYSFEDFFEEEVVPDLIRILGESQVEDSSKSVTDRFFDILRYSIQKDHRGGLSHRLLEVATNEDDGEITPDQFLRRCFSLRYDELELRKIEYSSPDGSIVNVNYRGVFEEQELQDKIVERIAEKE